MRRAKWIGNLSLRKKLVALFAAVGIGPLLVMFYWSYGELKDSVLSNQHYAANESFKQSLAALNSKFSHIEEISSMIMINESINRVFSSDPGRMEVWEQLDQFQQVTEYTLILQNNSEYAGITYYIDDRFVLVSESSMMYRPFHQIKQEPWAQKILNGGGEPVWSIVRESNGRSDLTLGRILWNTNNFAEPVGIVTIRVHPDTLVQYLTASSADQLVYLETEDGELAVSSRSDKLPLMRMPSPPKHTGRFAEVELPSGTHLARSDKIGESNLYLHSVISQHSLSEAVHAIRNRMLTAYFVVSALLLLVIYPVTRSMTSRIFLLMNKMTQVRQGRLNTLDIEPREDEVGHLVSSFNYMIGSVRELLQEQYKLGQEKQEAELRALQSQINPHFLYNTLDMIVWMAQKDERRNIQEAVYALSDYYKLILNKGDDFVTVEDELRLCLLYIGIQQYRFKDRIKFVVEVEEAAMACSLPKITLQPLVENAIVHGILEKPEGRGEITVKGTIAGGRLVIDVEDDGPGLKSHREHKPNRGSGYGIRNIEKRLELYFGEQNCIRTFGREGQAGFCVQINVPVVPRK